MPTYQHTQIGTFVLACLAIVATIMIVVSILVAEAAEGWVLFPGFFVVAILAVAGLLFGWLHVEVGRDAVQARFGLGLIRRTIQFEDIVAATPVRNRWWYGWGIRLTPHGWLFNVSGLDAVELELATGRKFRIGTDEPNELADAIQSALAAA